MSCLPYYIIQLGRLHKDRVYQEINSKLTATKDGKSLIYPILLLRFWCHAHIYSPVFSLIFFYIIGDGSSITKTTLPLLMISLGSLSFAICDSYGGAYADKNGCTASIRLGIELMIGLMVFFGAITLFHERLGATVFIVCWALGQIMVGLPLALIDGADTELTKQTARQLSVLSQEDGDHLEGICTKLKYSGIALTSFVGCFLFVLMPAWLGAGKILVGTGLFLLTAVSQAFALWQLRRVQEPARAGQEPERTADSATEFGRFRATLREIAADKVLATWILIIAVTEGWLLFATYYFQLHALKDLIEYAGQSLGLLFIIPLLYFLLSAMASFGGSYFNTWHKKAANAARREDSDVMRLRRGSVLDIPYVRLLAAGEILAIMLGVFVLHLAITTFCSQGDKPVGRRGYWFSLIPLIFFASYQFLRGFAHPLLKTTLSNLTATRSLRNPTTTLSIATATGRAFHAVSATLFTIFLLWISAQSTASHVPSVTKVGAVTREIPDATKALTATIVIAVLTILVLNLLCGVALDRNNKEEGETALRPRLNELPIIFADRAFRVSVIKGAFFVCLAMSNILGPKLSALGFLTFNAGAISYALSFMLVEATAETEGKTSSRRLWLAGICTYLVVGLLVEIALVLPGGQPAFQTLFREVLILIFASLCSFAVAQYLDIWLFLLLKRVTRGRVLWLRSNISTFIAQTVDTIIFIAIGFWHLHFSWLMLFTLVIGQLGVKWMFSLLYTPLLYLAVRWIEHGNDSDIAAKAFGTTSQAGSEPKVA